MGHELAAEIEHGALAGPLHEVGLAKIENEIEDDDGEIDEGELGEAGECVSGKPLIEGRKKYRGVFGRDEITVDGHLGNERSDTL